jgi:Ni/Co efflux regulator RcnB
MATKQYNLRPIFADTCRPDPRSPIKQQPSEIWAFRAMPFRPGSKKMSKLIKHALIAAMLVSVPAPILAQRHDGRQQASRNQRVTHAPARPNWREATTSRGNHWRRGQRLAVNQRRYVVNDWNQRGLRAPPRGYRWVRESSNSGDYLLIAVASGLIASILTQ